MTLFLPVLCHFRVFFGDILGTFCLYGATTYTQDVEAFWLTDAQQSSNTRDVARRYGTHLSFIQVFFACVIRINKPRKLGPKVWDKRSIEYINDTDEEKWRMFQRDHWEKLPWVSKATFMRWKPFWLRHAKWLSCACPRCYEIKCFQKTYARIVPEWHRQDAAAKIFENPRPGDAVPGPDDGTHCWHCRSRNPLFS